MDLSLPSHLSSVDAALVVARQAGLELSAERIRVAAPIFVEWCAAANRLSERMSAAQNQSVVPIVGLRHAATCQKGQQ